jgi:hypothetical protein
MHLPLKIWKPQWNEVFTASESKLIIYFIPKEYIYSGTYTANDFIGNDMKQTLHPKTFLTNTYITNKTLFLFSTPFWKRRISIKPASTFRSLTS